MEPVEHLVEQLWHTAMASPGVRVAVNPPGDAAWVDQERYWLVPTASRARLLLPDGPVAATAGVAAHYRGLRRRPEQAARTAATIGARLRLPLSPHRVHLQVHRDAVDDVELLLPRLASVLDVPRLYAAMGVRTGANRKVTLSLVDSDGMPRGYAKLGWNEATDTFVRTEAETLSRLGGREGPVRAPALLAHVDYGGHPCIVTAPLPPEVRGAGRVAAPSSAEWFTLTPISARTPLDQTAHFAALRSRIAGMSHNPVCAELAGRSLALARRAATDRRPIPVTALWHGDLTSWNVARDAAGTLWIWDWETAQPDAAAGLDPLHWSFSERRLRGRDLGQVRLADCLQDAGRHLTAAGLARDLWPLLGAVYALTVVDRACGLAARDGGWGRVWISPRTLGGLLDQAEHLLAGA